MNIQGRYENSLSDILTLLQEAVFRFVTDQEVDLSKFFQYFKQFYRNMASLEENFHQSKVKFTRYLSKINTLTSQIEFNKQKVISLEPSQKKIHQKSDFKHKIDSQSTFSKKTVPVDKNQQLNVIGEIQERQDFDEMRFQVNNEQYQRNLQKRVGTAEGLRHKMSVTIDFHNQRPYTGNHIGSNAGNRARKCSQKLFQQSNTKQRYRSLTKYQKTVNESVDNGFTMHPSESLTEKKIFNIGQRKRIYDVLEQQKKSRKNDVSEQQFLGAELVKLPQKKKSKNFSRWSFKINKLL